jgi:hypothetical protein
MVPLITSTAIHLWPSRNRNDNYGYYGCPTYRDYYRWVPWLLWAVVNTRNCGPDVQVSYG